MSRNKGINKLVVSDDTTPSLQELPVLASETLGVFVHSTNSTVPSKLFLSQGTSTQASFSGIEFDTDSGLGIFTDVPFVSSHDASIKFKARGTDYWKIEGVNGSSGDLLPLINNQLKIGRSGFNLAETFSRKITSDSTLALAAGGATKWNLDSGGNLIPSTANSQNFGATSTALSQIFGNQLNSGTGQALYLGSNGGAYQWRIANGTNAAFIPNSTYDIGASGSRVGKLWGTDIDVTGTINSGGFSSSGDVITNSIRTIGTSDNLVIKTGTGFAERLRITSDGKVGIGTTSPSETLHIKDSQPRIRLEDTDGGNSNIFASISGNTAATGSITIQADPSNAGADSFVVFEVDGAERLRIADDGDVGIGTASPGTKLDVSGSIRSSSQLISTVATGTAPLSVSSTTLVSNLNADLLDGQTGSYYLNYNNFTNTPTIGNGTLTLAVSGTGLSGSASFTANQTGATTFTVTSNATNANTASTIVARDASGNFSAGNITANLTGTASNATSATNATTATYLNTAASSSTADNITTRVNSGFWETSTATTAEGWPETTNTWYHLLSSTHSASTYWAMQFAGSFYDSNALFYRATGNDGNAAWNRIWHSGNDNLLGTSSNVASTIVRRDASSNVYASSLIASSIIGIPFSELNLTNITNNNISITTPNTKMEVIGDGTTGFRFSSVVSGVQHECGIIKAVGTGSSTKMVIYANRGDGGIELRTNRPSGGEQPALILDKTGISYFYNDIRHDIEEGTKPNIGASGSAGFNNIYAVNFVNTSDLRLKENIEKIEGAQNIIMQLNPVKFDWKNNTNQVKNSGFIAQEVHKLIPECVISGDDEVEIQEAWGISMNHVIPYLTKALQEAFEEIAELKKEIEKLKS